MQLGASTCCINNKPYLLQKIKKLVWSQDLYHEMTIFNANYSLHTTVELLSLGDLIGLITVISNSWKLIT